jgi:hypothetical protein
LRKYSTPQEILLTDIASDNARKSLKKTTPPVSKLSLRKYLYNFFIKINNLTAIKRETTVNYNFLVVLIYVFSLIFANALHILFII